MRHHASSRWTAGSAERRVILVLTAFLLLSIGLSAAGCGTSSSETSTTPAVETTATAAATDTTAPVALTPTQLGEAIGATWAEAVQGVDGLLDDQPEPAEARQDLAALKGQYIQKLVVYGAQRAELDDAGKAQVDAAVTSSLNAVADTEWYTNYLDIYDAYAYMSGDVDFVNLIASFSTLTQYADFDQLKEKAPDEAARLGIE